MRFLSYKWHFAWTSSLSRSIKRMDALLYHRCSVLCPPDLLLAFEYIMISQATGNEEVWGETDKGRGTFQQPEQSGSRVTCHLSMSGFSPSWMLIAHALLRQYDETWLKQSISIELGGGPAQCYEGSLCDNALTLPLLPCAENTAERPNQVVSELRAPLRSRKRWSKSASPVCPISMLSAAEVHVVSWSESCYSVIVTRN